MKIKYRFQKKFNKKKNSTKTKTLYIKNYIRFK